MPLNKIFVFGFGEYEILNKYNDKNPKWHLQDISLGILGDIGLLEEILKLHPFSRSEQNIFCPLIIIILISFK